MPMRLHLFLLPAALLVLAATATTSAAPVTTRGLTFNLTKRNDYVILTQVGKGYEFKVEHWDKASDKTTVASKFIAVPQGSPERFTLMHPGDGGEVRVEIRHLPAYFAGPVPETLNNKGEWSMTIAGHGTPFKKLRHYLVNHRWPTDWKGEGDLTFYGGSFTTTSYLNY